MSGTGDSDNTAFTIGSSGELRTAAIFDFENRSSYSIRVRSTDGGGLFTERAFVISITNVNEPPTSLSIDSAMINRNSTGDEVVGAFSATDPDQEDVLSFAFTSGAGDNDNSLFSIDDERNLRTAFAINASDRKIFTIRVRANDFDGLGIERIFTITSDASESAASPAIMLSHSSVEENSRSAQ